MGCGIRHLVSSRNPFLKKSLVPTNGKAQLVILLHLIFMHCNVIARERSFIYVERNSALLSAMICTLYIRSL
jgi:hypothetical protein